MSISKNRWLMGLAEQSCRAVTSSDGRFTHSDAVEELQRALSATALDPGLQAVLNGHVADLAVAGFSDSRNPRRHRDDSWYDPFDVMKLGRGNRVWMSHSIRSDMIVWLRLSSKNRIAVQDADRSRQKYGKTRLHAFGTSKDLRYLHQIEQLHFGYQSEADDPPVLL